jgi:hypothetical protein
MCFPVIECFAPNGAKKLVWVTMFYKHLVPLGPKTIAPKNTDWFVTRTLESGH